MKKNGILLIILAIITSATLFNGYATAENNLNILTANGTASINVEPDTAVISIAVETENVLLSQALQENSNKSQKVITEIKKLMGKDDSVKTTGFNVKPVYNYDNKERKRTLTNYRVTNMVNVKIKKLSDIGKIIDTAIKNGANKVEDLNFMIENKDKYSSELLKKASLQAKQKAAATTEALGLCIKGINRVSTDFSDENISPYYRSSFSSAEMMKSDSAGSSLPIEAGEIKLKATVSVDFIIENQK